MLFRGTERNKRSGFHNLHVFSTEIEARAEALTGRLWSLRMMGKADETFGSRPLLSDRGREFSTASRLTARSCRRSPPSRAFTVMIRLEIDGYQRPEALAHIRAIQRYMESEDPLLPNALVVAFDKRVKFEPVDKRPTRTGAFGDLVIPIDPDLQMRTSQVGW